MLRICSDSGFSDFSAGRWFFPIVASIVTCESSYCSVVIWAWVRRKLWIFPFDWLQVRRIFIRAPLCILSTARLRMSRPRAVFAEMVMLSGKRVWRVSSRPSLPTASTLLRTFRTGFSPQPISARTAFTESICFRASGFAASMTWRRRSALIASSRVALKDATSW